MYSEEFHTRTVIYIISLVVCSCLVLLQSWNLLLTVSSRSGTAKPPTKRSISPFQLMIPLVCSNMAFIVALVFYLLAHYGFFKDAQCIFCDFTIPFGGVLYVVGKCGIYLFYSRRASVSQGIIQNFPKYLTKFLLPFYITCIFIVYAVCFPIFFKGECYISDDINLIDTGCDLGQYPLWMAWLGSACDLITNCLFVAIFAYPLVQSFYMTESLFKTKGVRKKKFIATMKWNFGLTALNAISTSFAMFLVAIFAEYWWLYTLDFAINGLSTFLMMGVNRRFLKYNMFCWCYYKQISREKELKRDHHKQSSIRGSSSKSPPLDPVHSEPPASTVLCNVNTLSTLSTMHSTGSRVSNISVLSEGPAGVPVGSKNNQLPPLPSLETYPSNSSVSSACPADARKDDTPTLNARSVASVISVASVNVVRAGSASAPSGHSTDGPEKMEISAKFDNDDKGDQSDTERVMQNMRPVSVRFFSPSTTLNGSDYGSDPEATEGVQQLPPPAGNRNDEESSDAGNYSVKYDSASDMYGN